MRLNRAKKGQKWLRSVQNAQKMVKKSDEKKFQDLSKKFRKG